MPRRRAATAADAGADADGGVFDTPARGVHALRPAAAEARDWALVAAHAQAVGDVRKGGCRRANCLAEPTLRSTRTPLRSSSAAWGCWQKRRRPPPRTGTWKRMRPRTSWPSRPKCMETLAASPGGLSLLVKWAAATGNSRQREMAAAAAEIGLHVGTDHLRTAGGTRLPSTLRAAGAVWARLTSGHPHPDARRAGRLLTILATNGAGALDAVLRAAPGAGTTAFPLGATSELSDDAHGHCWGCGCSRQLDDAPAAGVRDAATLRACTCVLPFLCLRVGCALPHCLGSRAYSPCGLVDGELPYERRSLKPRTNKTDRVLAACRRPAVQFDPDWSDQSGQAAHIPQIAAGTLYILLIPEF